MSRSPLPDVREYLAAERTLLSYIRTGLALMGLGFVVARFALFLKEFQLLRPHLSPASQTPGMSHWLGTGLVILGVALNLFAVWEYRSLIYRLNAQYGGEGWPPARLAVGTSLVLAMIGVAMAAYLVWLGP